MNTEIGIGIRLLETLTSALYEDPIVLFREYVQNSVDAFVKNPVTEAKVDISVDKENEIITFYDNGCGISSDSFLEKMTTLGNSDKYGANDQIGFRGIGRLSAMPFCDELVFFNKVAGSTKLQTFTWEGNTYNKLLMQANESDLKAAIGQIARNEEVEYRGNSLDHFFKVEIRKYHQEIKLLVDDGLFNEKLCKLLPLPYRDDFSGADEIRSHYKEYMNSDLEKYEFAVFLDGKQLFKPYRDVHILDSKLVFWDISMKDANTHEHKIGILWFTFNRKVTGNPVGSPRGIFVRSKNMLMGNEYSVADAVSKGSGEYVGSYRELTQTLNGVYGEILLDTKVLSDNARRDWFKIDAQSNQLKYILSDYMKKLVSFRYAASKMFNDKREDAQKTMSLRATASEAFASLTQGVYLDEMTKKVFEPDFVTEDIGGFEYADDDIPRYSILVKRFYDKLADIARSYFVEGDSENGIESFIKMRTYIKRKLNGDDSNSPENSK